RIGGRGVRVIAPLLAVEVALAIAPAALWRRLSTVLRPEALHRGPGFDQGPVHAEVLVRQQRLDLWQRHYPDPETPRDIAFQKAIPFLAEYRRVPYCLVGRKPDKPAKQKVVVELLHQKPLRADCVERLQQKRAQKSFRGNRRSPNPRIQLLKLTRQAAQ